MIESGIPFIETLFHSNTIAMSSLAVFLATFFAGENGALFSILLALQGFIPMTDAIVFSFLGSLSADLFWYAITVSTIRPWVDRRLQKRMSEGKNEQKPLFSIADRYPYTILVFIKFLVGIRLILTIYVVAKKRIHLSLYLICNILANILFIGVLFVLAWFLNEGTDYALHAEKNITRLIATVMAVGIGANILLRVFEHVVLNFLKKRKQGGGGL